MFEEVGFISQVIKAGPVGRFDAREQVFSTHPYGSPMDTEIAIPKIPDVDFAASQWRSNSNSYEAMCDTFLAVQVGDLLSESVSAMMDRLSLYRRQSLQAHATMDLDKTDSSSQSFFEPESMSLCIETDKEPATRGIEFPPTPPLTPPSLPTSQTPPNPSHTPGSMSRLRSIAPRAIATSHEEPVFTASGPHVGQAGGYAPRIRCVSLPVVSPMSGIEVNGFRDVRACQQPFEPLDNQDSNAHSGLWKAWHPV